ncbi:MAG: sensor histidine kinase [Micrococcales bacterium]|nr:sensor histidine kinase [Micrococcales bacterium]
MTPEPNPYAPPPDDRPLWRRVRAFPREHTGWWDIGTAVLFWLMFGSFWVIVLAEGAAGRPNQAFPHADIVALLVTSILHTVGVALRRLRPVVGFWSVVAGCLVQLVGTDAVAPTDAAVLVAAYSLTRNTRSQLQRRLGLVVCAVSGYLAAWDWRGEIGPASVTGMILNGTFLSAFVIVFWVWGDLNRKREELVSGLEAQNAALRRERDQRAQLAAQAERTRIAREMHDIVAHSLSVVVVQSDGAAYAAEHGDVWDRQQAAGALKTIGETARSALAETRRLVGVLRQEGDNADYTPTTGLAEIDELVEGTRSAGLPVELEERGTRRALSHEADLAAYRIVQESLTNVLRHAGPGAAARVTVDYGEPLRVEVRDNGAGATTTDGLGNGLIGMRERVAQVGGDFHAGPAPGGGWRVQATIPTKEQRQ